MQKEIKKIGLKKVKEVIDREKDSLYSSKGRFYAGQFWTNLHLWIGIPTAILAAIAGASALSQFDNNNVIAGILAIFVAALIAVTTFLNPNEKATIHHNAGNEYNNLRNRARIFCEVDINLAKDIVDLTEELKKEMN